MVCVKIRRQVLRICTPSNACGAILAQLAWTTAAAAAATAPEASPSCSCIEVHVGRPCLRAQQLPPAVVACRQQVRFCNAHLLHGVGAAAEWSGGVAS